MAVVYSQNIIECALYGTHAGRPVVNVLHLHNDEGAQSDSSKVRDLCDNWQDHIVVALSSAYVFEGINWRSLDPDDNNVGLVLADPAKQTTGGGQATAASPNVAYLVHKITANRPRGKRDGRMFLAGVGETTIDNAGNLESGFLDAWATVLDTFLDGVNDDVFGNGGGSGLAVLETPPAARVPGTAPVTVDWRPVVSLRMDPKVSSQRDRLR